MNNIEIIAALETYLDSVPLPGLGAHVQMAPPGRIKPDYDATPPEAKKAAVLLLLHEVEERLRIPLIVRADNGGYHSGQVALPGGMHEDGEKYPLETALREANEEIALSAKRVKILGNMSPLYIPVSNISVSPVVGFARGELRLYPDHREVQKICFIDLDELLLQPKTGFFQSGSLGKSVEAPYFDSNAGNIWGATAMILFELADIIRQIRT